MFANSKKARLHAKSRRYFPKTQCCVYTTVDHSVVYSYPILPYSMVLDASPGWGGGMLSQYSTCRVLNYKLKNGMVPEEQTVNSCFGLIGLCQRSAALGGPATSTVDIRHQWLK